MCNGIKCILIQSYFVCCLRSLQFSEFESTLLRCPCRTNCKFRCFLVYLKLVSFLVYWPNPAPVSFLIRVSSDQLLF